MHLTQGNSNQAPTNIELGKCPTSLATTSEANTLGYQNKTIMWVAFNYVNTCISESFTLFLYVMITSYLLYHEEKQDASRAT